MVVGQLITIVFISSKEQEIQVSDDIQSPYEDDLKKAQTSLEIVEGGDNGKPVLQSFEELIEAGKVGLTWNEFLEVVQFLSIRYTKGDDTPSEWTDIQLKAMYSDLQYWTFGDVQSAVVKLHNEGQYSAPNSSQIIGKINKLGFKEVISQQKIRQISRGEVGECKAGGEHEWFELGWLHNEYGDPEFFVTCNKRVSVEARACGAEKVITAPPHQEFQKPEPMWLEKFVDTAKGMGLPDHKIDWMLSNSRPHLRTYAEHLEKYGKKEEVVEGTIE